jgi:hypothetical protein
MGSKLYTMVCDFRGGAYFSQVAATDEYQAARAWAAMLKTERPIPRASSYIAAAVIRDLDGGGKLAPLGGLRGAWCLSAVVGKQNSLVLLNIIHSA